VVVAVMADPRGAPSLVWLKDVYLEGGRNDPVLNMNHLESAHRAVAASTPGASPPLIVTD
jgi:hypothetical protein